MTTQANLDYFYSRYIIQLHRDVIRVEDDGKGGLRAIVSEFFSLPDGTTARISDLLKELNANPDRYHILRP